VKAPKTTILSINRFERKKNIKLAVDAFILLKQLVPKEFSGLELVLAGGYDPNLPENVEHVKELKALVVANNINDQVRFLLSFSNEEKKIRTCSLYLFIVYSIS